MSIVVTPTGRIINYGDRDREITKLHHKIIGAMMMADVKKIKIENDLKKKIEKLLGDKWELKKS